MCEITSGCSGGSRPGPGGGASAPSLFFQAPQFFHRLLIIAPPPLRARGPGPQSVLARTATDWLKMK